MTDNKEEKKDSKVLSPDDLIKKRYDRIVEEKTFPKRWLMRPGQRYGAWIEEEAKRCREEYDHDHEDFTLRGYLIDDTDEEYFIYNFFKEGPPGKDWRFTFRFTKVYCKDKDTNTEYKATDLDVYLERV